MTKQSKLPAVYIAANFINGTIYIGVTSDLIKRIYEHQNEIIKGFTAKYGCKSLVYYEIYEDMETAILREKRLKKYRRQDKIKLIEKENPEWLDLYSSVIA